MCKTVGCENFSLCWPRSAVKSEETERTSGECAGLFSFRMLYVLGVCSAWFFFPVPQDGTCLCWNTHRYPLYYKCPFSAVLAGQQGAWTTHRWQRGLTRVCLGAIIGKQLHCEGSPGTKAGSHRHWDSTM